MIDLNSSPAISSSFRYRKVYEKGKPVHGKNDGFYIKHPPMDLSKRAKIFSPFDALKGYDEALRAAETENTARYESIYTDNSQEGSEPYVF